MQFTRLHTPWPQDFFIYKPFQLPPKSINPSCYHAAGNYSNTQSSLCYQAPTHGTSGSRECTCGNIPYLGAQRHSKFSQPPIEPAISRLEVAQATTYRATTSHTVILRRYWKNLSVHPLRSNSNYISVFFRLPYPS